MCLKTSEDDPFSLFFSDPCVPQNLEASVNCDSKVVSLSWDASNGTKMYMVSAEGGYRSIGLTTNATTAYFSDFICGQNYSLTVTPQNQQCLGSASAPASIQTCRFYTDMHSVHVKESNMSSSHGDVNS